MRSLSRLALLLPLLLPGPGAAGTFVFGDSSVEQGNLYARPGFDRTGSPYWAPDGFSRESNGPVWVEDLVPGIAPAAGAAPGSRDVNFAYSGATSGTDNIAGPVAATGLGAQVDEFLARSLRGEAGDLFVVAIGTNDFIRDTGTRELHETSSEVVGNIARGLDRLAQAGAGRILVEDVPDFHLAPAFDGIVPPAERPALDRVMREILDAHRAVEIAALRAQNARLPGTDLVTVKVSRLFDHVLAHAAELGFPEAATPCLDEATGVLCSTDRAEQNRHLFFDGLHLTEAGQRIQADYYRALLATLDGKAHALPAGLLEDSSAWADGLAASARDERALAWGAAMPEAGVSVSTGLAAGSEDGTLGTLALGWSDGRDWTGRLSLGRHGGSGDLDGWSVVASGERRWGALRLGATVGALEGEAEDRRDLGVALMGTNHDARTQARFAEVALGAELHRGAFALEPSAWARWREVTLDAFEETGRTGLEMAFDGTTFSGLSAGAAVTLRYEGWESATPWVTLACEGTVAGGDGTLTGRLVDNSAEDIRREVALPDAGASLRAGVALDLGARTRLDLAGWTGETGGSGFSVRLTRRF